MDINSVASRYFLVLPRPINFDVERARVSPGDEKHMATLTFVVG